MRDILSQVCAKSSEFFKILCTKYMTSSEAMTSSTRSFAYSYRLVKKCFVKTCLKLAKLSYTVLSFINQFSSGFHCFVHKIIILISSEITVKPVPEFHFKHNLFFMTLYRKFMLTPVITIPGFTENIC